MATQLARLPVISPDQTTLALVSVDQPAARTTVTLSLVDTASMAVVSGGILTMRDLPAGTLVLVTPVFAAGSTTVAVVLSITIPTNMRTVSKPHPHTGKTITVPTAIWTSHHALAYFDRHSASFSGPYHLSDAPSLALVSAVADASRLYLWTVKEAAALPSWKGKGLPNKAPVPRLAAYPLGSATPSYSVAAPGPWPTGDEPVLMLGTRDIARLVNGREILLYTARTGRMRPIRIPALGLPSAKPGSVTMQARPDGIVFINNPAIGRAVLTGSGGSFTTVSVVNYPRPAVPFGGPASKAVLSPDGATLYVLGAAGAGGLSAYDVHTGALTASYSHGEDYTGVYQLPSGAVLAVSPVTPQLVFFTPSLEPIGTADTDLHVAEVF